MSAPLIWIGLPLVIAVILWFLNRRVALVIWVGTLTCALLVLLAGILPIGGVLRAGPLALEIGTTLTLFGRRFILDAGSQSYLMLVYGFGAFWFFGTTLVHVHRYFVPLSLAIIALLVAALAVEPFLYGALLIEIAVLLSVPMLAPPGHPPSQGVLRYIIFQTLAIPFVLFAGWAAAGVEANPADQRLLSEAVVLLGLGFAFWLATFPFYNWVPLLSERSHSYVSGFLLSLLPMVVLLLVLHFLENFSWLRDYRYLPVVFRSTGVVMVVTGGIWAAFQRSLSRLFGYAVIIENGFALLALSLVSRAGLEIYVASMLPRLVALWVWALALALLREESSPEYEAIEGLMHRYPLIAGALVIAPLSLAGLPLLAGFPLREVLLEGIGQRSLPVALWSLVGSAGLLFGTLRAFSAMLKTEEQRWGFLESWPQAVFLSAGILALILMGLLPRIYLPEMQNLLQSFGRLY